MSMNVKKGDAVMIIAGCDKGKTGQIDSVDTKSGRVVVKGEGLRTEKHFVKPRNAQEKGGIVERERAIDASNVMVLCPTCGAATKVAHKVVTDENGKVVKERVCKKCGASLDNVSKTKAKATAKKGAKTAKKSSSKKAGKTETENN